MNFRAYDVKYLTAQYDVGEKMVLVILLSMRNLPEIFISQKQLAKQASLSLPTLKRKLDSLKEKGVLTTETRGEGKTLMYNIDISILVRHVEKENSKVFKKMERHFE